MSLRFSSLWARFRYAMVLLFPSCYNRIHFGTKQTYIGPSMKLCSIFPFILFSFLCVFVLCLFFFWLVICFLLLFCFLVLQAHCYPNTSILHRYMLWKKECVIKTHYESKTCNKKEENNCLSVITPPVSLFNEYR